MGSGIAQVAAQSGHAVLLSDRSDEFIQRGLAGIGRNLARSVEKERITAQEREAVLAKIQPTPKIEKLDVDIAIEAATENLELKLELFRTLHGATPHGAILASNTSSISI